MAAIEIKDTGLCMYGDTYATYCNFPPFHDPYIYMFQFTQAVQCTLISTNLNLYIHSSSLHIPKILCVKSGLEY